MPSFSQQSTHLADLTPLPGNPWLPLLIPPSVHALSCSLMQMHCDPDCYLYQLLPMFQRRDVDPPFLRIYCSQWNWHDAHSMDNEGARDMAGYSSVSPWPGRLPCCLVFLQELDIWKTQPGNELSPLSSGDGGGGLCISLQFGTCYVAEDNLGLQVCTATPSFMWYWVI